MSVLCCMDRMVLHEITDKNTFIMPSSTVQAFLCVIYVYVSLGGTCRVLCILLPMKKKNVNINRVQNTYFIST